MASRASARVRGGAVPQTESLNGNRKRRREVEADEGDSEPDSPSRQLNEEQAQSQSRLKASRRTEEPHVLFNKTLNSTAHQTRSKAAAEQQRPRKSDRDAAKQAIEKTHRQYSKDRTEAFSPTAFRSDPPSEPRLSSGKLPTIDKAKSRDKAPSKPAVVEEPKKARGRPRKKPRGPRAAAVPNEEPSNSQQRATRRSREAAANPQALPGPNKSKSKGAPFLVRRTVSGGTQIGNGNDSSHESDADDDNVDDAMRDPGAASINVGEALPANGTEEEEEYVPEDENEEGEENAEQDGQEKEDHVESEEESVANGDAGVPDPKQATNGRTSGTPSSRPQQQDEDSDSEAGGSNAGLSGDENNADPNNDAFEIPAGRSHWWYGMHDSLYTALRFARELAKNDYPKGRMAASRCSAMDDVLAQLTALDQGSPLNQPILNSLSEIDQQTSEYLRKRPHPHDSLPSAKKTLDDITHAIVPKLVELAIQLLNFISDTPALTKPQLLVVMKVLTLLFRCKKKVDALKRRHNASITVRQKLRQLHTNLSATLKTFYKELTRLGADEQAALARAMATDPSRIRESERYQREREAIEAPLRAWRAHWLALHVDRREAETANFLRFLPRNKVNLLQDIPIDQVATTEKPWIIAYRASLSSPQPAPGPSSGPRSSQPPNSTPPAPSPELDANGDPFERVEDLTPRRTPRPRNPTLEPERDTGDGISSWSDADVARHFATLSYSGPEWTSAQDEALLMAMERHHDVEGGENGEEGEGGGESGWQVERGGEEQWRGVIRDTCSSTRNERTGGWTDGPLVAFTVAEIVERGVWWRDMLWLDGERHEKGGRLEGWVKRVRDVRVRPGGWQA
ncbi:hypothetical protein KVT40_007184 [Elsinoe batatas]|uniref:Uncharacterized protein n=1 Tax=Elsinoe batatas TaxID=2601811 RepID=A0A8K0L444_9PEZI|nr:hypothetical protein KVT40_007184 [Elsinoe batatas]